MNVYMVRQYSITVNNYSYFRANSYCIPSSPTCLPETRMVWNAERTHRETTNNKSGSFPSHLQLQKLHQGHTTCAHGAFKRAFFLFHGRLRFRINFRLRRLFASPPSHPYRQWWQTGRPQWLHGAPSLGILLKFSRQEGSTTKLL